MNGNLKRNVESALTVLQEEVIVECNKSIRPIFIFLHLLIPILSVEGVFSWGIGIWGAYKIINIYKNAEKDQTKKAIKTLMISWTVAAVYNILVYYVTRIVIAKVV